MKPQNPGRVIFTRPADTAAYLAGDVVGASTGASAAIEFKNLGLPWGHVMITHTELSVYLAALPSTMGAHRLHLYSANPPSALVDNAPWDLPAADREYYVGYVDLGTPLDAGTTLFIQTTIDNKNVQLGETGSLFGYLVTTPAYTPSSGIEFNVRLNAVGVV